MDAEVASRYRSRILREMNANRDNPFNSPPSSTGSHGTVSPTLTSVLSDIDGESTRKLNADIARITGKKFQVNWEAAHRKWPDFYDLPSKRVSSSSRDSKVPLYPDHLDDEDDSTQDAWRGSNRRRAEMQPSVQNESDTSTVLSGKAEHLRSASTHFDRHEFQKHSPLPRAHSRSPSSPQYAAELSSRRTSVDALLNKHRASTASPELRRPSQQQHASQRRSLGTNFAKFSPAVQKALDRELPISSPGQNNTTARSFCMPDISYLGDFVSGTLRFNGTVKNGVPILVKHGKVIDLNSRQPPNDHAEVDGFEVPEDEERIFVSMDMIRDEIITLQDHHDGIQKYAEELQVEVEQLQTQIAQLKMRRSVDSGFGSEPDGSMYEQLLSDKKRLEERVAELEKLLEEANGKLNDEGKNNDTLSFERDRALKKLQDACHNIGDLMDRLDSREQELRDTQKQLDVTLNSKDVNSTLRDDLESMKRAHEGSVHEIASLKETIQKLRDEQKSQQAEIESLRTDNVSLRHEQESLMTENRSLRSNARTLMTEIEGLRHNSENAQNEVDAAREEIENLQQEVQVLEQEKATFKEDNDSLVRHNEKYFSENKILRRENSGFERSLHDLHDENLQLKEEVEFLKQQLDHVRPSGRDDDLSGHFSRHDEDNMTSGFTVPDITLQRKEPEIVEEGATETDMLPPDVTTQTHDITGQQEDKSMDIRETIEKDESIIATETQTKNRKKSKGVRDNTSQRVAFSVPEAAAQETKAKPNIAAKRRTAIPREASKNDFAIPINFPLEQESTGYQSTEPTQTHPLSQNTKSQTVHSTTKSQRSSKRTININNQRSASRSGHRSAASTGHVSVENTVNSMASALDRNACPALSEKARRILDNLCEHNCRNCVVCSRILGHRGTVSAAELAEGKKKITIPRPVPVTDRMNEVSEDPTMRPSQPPGQALALVIKGLEDEAAHMSMELTKLQAQYNTSDKSHGRRDRHELASEIQRMLKKLEVKNDQIYALYDVLEGQKQANQEMSEDELELTIFSITGMTVREVREVTDNITWNGIEG
ncbi:hypothetical protein jhhlp_000987 [Lomentospora prolificans]|uniref:Cep57 centrosome microtubule-binding domain-containing protein n=1 Tax=Lomentospora prolificans TaxID=41688 RepID=A0A2N3NJZ9_9PEZI|nr:hypothetical protein jhhlp_000987 [Lomentospora prolificans]